MQQSLQIYRSNLSLSLVITIALIAFGLLCALLLRRSLPHEYRVFSGAGASSKKTFFLWVLTSFFVYVPLVALCVREILYHIHVSTLAMKLNVTFATMNLMITLVSVPVAVGGEILLLLLFIKKTNISSTKGKFSDVGASTNKVWPPAPRR